MGKQKRCPYCGTYPCNCKDKKKEAPKDDWWERYYKAMESFMESGERR